MSELEYLTKIESAKICIKHKIKFINNCPICNNKGIKLKKENTRWKRTKLTV